MVHTAVKVTIYSSRINSLPYAEINCIRYFLSEEKYTEDAREHYSEEDIWAQEIGKKRKEKST